MKSSDDDAIIIPRRGKHENLLPRTGIILVNPKEAALGHSLVVERGGEIRGFPHSKLSVNAGRNCVAGPAVGSPIAAMVVEKLIALGVDRIFMLSWCGALSPDLKIGDVVIGGNPLSGEGTSHYYRTGVAAAPSPRLSNMLLQWASDKGLEPVSGRIWSTDAPYRESRTLLQKLQREGKTLSVSIWNTPPFVRSAPSDRSNSPLYSWSRTNCWEKSGSLVLRIRIFRKSTKD